MKSNNYFALLAGINICFLNIFPVIADNPYNSGGKQFGQESNALESVDYNYSNLGSGQGYYSNNSTNQKSAVSEPVSVSPFNNPVSQSSYNANATNSVNQPPISPYREADLSRSNKKPWDKMGSWIQEKRTKNIDDPEKDIANQRIEAGKARIKALKAKEKLDKFIADSESKILELQNEVKQAEQQAEFLENQLKFQESNIAK